MGLRATCIATRRGTQGLLWVLVVSKLHSDENAKNNPIFQSFYQLRIAMWAQPRVSPVRARP